MECLREVASFNPQKAVNWRKFNAFSVHFYQFIQLSNFNQTKRKKSKTFSECVALIRQINKKEKDDFV